MYPSHRRRARHSPLLLALIPISAGLFVAAAMWIVFGGLSGANRGAVLGATATPSTVAAASSTSRPTDAPRPSPSQTASPSPTPSPTLAPTPTPAITPPPRPATPTPTRAAPVPPAGPTTPDAAVASFYDFVEAHQFDAAAALWTDRMRAEYPPDGYIDGRFAPTTAIDLNRNEVIALNSAAGTAVVAVDLIEHRTVEPTPRRFVGTWDLVRTPSGWLLDEPHF
jgi:hypothetical protein